MGKKVLKEQHIQRRERKKEMKARRLEGGTCEMTDRETEYILFTSAVKSYFTCVKKKTKG